MFVAFAQKPPVGGATPEKHMLERVGGANSDQYGMRRFSIGGAGASVVERLKEASLTVHVVEMEDIDQLHGTADSSLCVLGAV